MCTHDKTTIYLVANYYYKKPKRDLLPSHMSNVMHGKMIMIYKTSTLPGT